jgi:hypothetical protein
MSKLSARLPDFPSVRDHRANRKCRIFPTPGATMQMEDSLCCHARTLIRAPAAGQTAEVGLDCLVKPSAVRLGDVG